MTESVYRLSPSRTPPSKSGAGLPVPQYMRLSSGSYMPVTQQLPPPRAHASPSAGQVADPRSPGFGTVYVRQTCRPVSIWNASRWPRTPNSPPELPTMTRFFTTRGATVALSPARTSPCTVSQTFSPVSASSAITWAFRVATKTFPFATATPRFTLPQQSDTSYGIACLYRHSSCPVRASRAQTQPSQPETYITPSTTIGAASNEYVDGPACMPEEPAWNTHAGRRRLTFSVLIWSSGL